MTDLREELRLIGCHANGDARCTCNIGQDALALIDSQAAEIERLQAQVQSAALDYLALDGQAYKALAEAETLRAALRPFADVLSRYQSPPSLIGMVDDDTGARLNVMHINAFRAASAALGREG